LGLASEFTWSVLAALSSLLLTMGLMARAVEPQSEDEPRDRPPGAFERSREGTIHLASAIAIPIGCACLVLFAGLAAGSRHLRLTTSEGVIVAPEARLVTEKGVLTSGGPIPEAARVEVGDQRGGLVHIRWGSVEGFTQGDVVR